MTKQNTATIGHNVAPVTIRQLAKKWAANKGREFAIKLVLVDLIKAEGGTVEDLKDKEHTLHKDVNAGIIDNFPASVEKLLALNKTDAKKLPKTAPEGTPPSKDYKSKAGRKYWQQQVGSYRGKIIAAMTPPKPGSKRPPRKDDNQWFTDWLNNGVKRIQSSETLKCDVEEFTAWMNKCPLSK